MLRWSKVTNSSSSSSRGDRQTGHKKTHAPFEPTADRDLKTNGRNTAAERKAPRVYVGYTGTAITLAELSIASSTSSQKTAVSVEYTACTKRNGLSRLLPSSWSRQQHVDTWYLPNVLFSGMLYFSPVVVAGPFSRSRLRGHAGG